MTYSCCWGLCCVLSSFLHSCRRTEKQQSCAGGLNCSRACQKRTRKKRPESIRAHMQGTCIRIALSQVQQYVQCRFLTCAERADQLILPRSPASASVCALCNRVGSLGYMINSMAGTVVCIVRAAAAARTSSCPSVHGVS